MWCLQESKYSFDFKKQRNVHFPTMLFHGNINIMNINIININIKKKKSLVC